MTHAAGARLVAVDALDLFGNVNIFRKTGRLRKIFAQVAVPPPPLHGPRVAHEGAAAPAGAVRRRRNAAERMDPLFARRRVVAIEAARMADIAGFLLRDRLVVREREIDLCNDLFRIFEGELVAFRPADRLGVRERTALNYSGRGCRSRPAWSAAGSSRPCCSWRTASPLQGGRRICRRSSARYGDRIPG